MDVKDHRMLIHSKTAESWLTLAETELSKDLESVEEKYLWTVIKQIALTYRDRIAEEADLIEISLFTRLLCMYMDTMNAYEYLRSGSDKEVAEDFLRRNIILYHVNDEGELDKLYEFISLDINTPLPKNLKKEDLN